ncbi:MAG: hypothetical protein HRT87_01075 [Legionellales bacterium]|nr:hypothetical protein [Legionellales bacterium]
MSSFNKAIIDYSLLLENIDGCGIIENYQDGHIIYAFKATEQDDYKLDTNLIRITSIDEPIHDNLTREQTLGFILHEPDSFFRKQFAVEYGFYLTEQLIEPTDYRIYFFTSFNTAIYHSIVNEQDLVKGFVNFFKGYNNSLINKFLQIKSDFDKERSKYYQEPNNFKYLSDKEYFLESLKNLGCSKKDISLQNEEWLMLDSYTYGLIHNVEMHHIFGMSFKELKSRCKEITQKILK